MATLKDIIERQSRPGAWAEGDNIPWHDPEFSRRMLREHLTQDHDMASRRMVKVRGHVAWIQRRFLAGAARRVRLYSQALARLGHTVVGIDYSPASIAYAREQAANEGASCSFIESDLRDADFGQAFDLAMLLFGEFNIFRPEHIQAILAKAYAALVPGGTLLVEVHTLDYVKKMGLASANWESTETGVFGDKPHLILLEHFWDAEAKQTMQRYYAIDADTGHVQPYAQTFQGYDGDDYRRVLGDAGFRDIDMYPSLLGVVDEEQAGLFVISASRPE